MPELQGHPVTIIIIVITVLVSLWGFSSPVVLEKLIFEPEKILRDKESYRMVTSALLHGSLPHLLFNMFSLYSFGKNIEEIYGPATLLFIYLSSVIGGSALSLLVHRHHVYRALGASGGVCGVIFAAIFLIPGTGVRFIFVPVDIPAWAYAIGFLVISFFAMKSGRGNIGHDAHLGGAIIGLIVTTILYPRIVFQQPYLFAGVMVLSLAILIYLIKNPLLLPLRSLIEAARTARPPPERPMTPLDEMRRVNEILDKISRKGIDSLTAEEHKLLDEASRKRHRGGE